MGNSVSPVAVSSQPLQPSPWVAAGGGCAGGNGCDAVIGAPPLQPWHLIPNSHFLGLAMGRILIRILARVELAYELRDFKPLIQKQ